MEIPAADEGEPSEQKMILPLFRFIFFVLLIFFAACRQKKTETKENLPMPVVPDSTLIRMKQQQLEDSLKRAMVPRKKIYITFDDGPNKGTRNVLQTVKQEHIPASFFVVGKHVFDTPGQGETFRELKADSSIELCNHSFTHALNRYNSFYLHPEKVISDFQQNEDRLSLTSKITRMPGRNAWRIDSVVHTDITESKAAIDSVYNAGFAVMGWDVEWTFDHKTLEPAADTELLLRRIQNMLEADKTRTPGHLVLLAHDQAFQKEAAVEKLHYVLQQLKNNPAYELVLASQYPGVKNDKPVSSSVGPVPDVRK